MKEERKEGEGKVNKGGREGGREREGEGGREGEGREMKRGKDTMMIWPN